VSPHSLRPHPGNAKRHPKSQIAKISRSIQRFGFVNPVLVSDGGEIIAGEARVEAAKKAGLDRIPVVRLSSLAAAERVAYNLADNKLADLGHLDRELVTVQLEELTSLGFDDIEITGLSPDDIDIHLEAAVTKKKRSTATTGVAPRGSELWVFGVHRMLAEDTKAIAECRRLIDRRQRELVPANSDLSIPAHRYQHPARGDQIWSEGKFRALVSAFLHLAKQASSIGASVSVFVEHDAKVNTKEERK
jgi:hypothetical protein